MRGVVCGRCTNLALRLLDTLTTGKLEIQAEPARNYSLLVALERQQRSGGLQSHAARIFSKVKLELLLVHSDAVTQLGDDEVCAQVETLLYVQVLVYDASHVAVEALQEREPRSQLEVLPPLLDAESCAVAHERLEETRLLLDP